MQTPGRYTKRPVTIEAIQYVGKNADAVCRFLGAGNSHTHGLGAGAPFHIHTLEGTMELRPGAWVIKGVRGEFYPCDPEIFQETYTMADGDE